MPDEKQQLEITRRVMADAHRYPCNILIRQAWYLIAGLDLARKHPGLHKPMKAELRQIVKRIQKTIVERHPAVAKAFDQAQQMDPAEWEAQVMPAMADPEPIAFTLSIRETWLLVSALQLTIRHPQMPDAAGMIGLTRQFQQQIDATHPDASDLIERGWNMQYDVR